MLVVVAYDVNTETKEGRKSLRHVAKICTNVGIRVQNSVFECHVDAAECKVLKHRLEQAIDTERDSLRFYYLGNRYQSKVEHIGAKETIDMEEPLIL